MTTDNRTGGSTATHEITEKYQPLVWQLVTSALGYQSVHETDENGKPGDIVASVYGEHVSLIAAAPDLLEALVALVGDGGEGMLFSARLAAARAAIAKATGK